MNKRLTKLKSLIDDGTIPTILEVRTKPKDYSHINHKWFAEFCVDYNGGVHKDYFRFDNKLQMLVKTK